MGTMDIFDMWFKSGKKELKMRFFARMYHDIVNS